MTFVKRLRLLTALFGIAAATAVVGNVVFGDISGRPQQATANRAKPDDVQAATEMARTKFTNQPTLTYKLATGETVFAWQVKPDLAATAPRPRDILVMIDTSASQAGAPMDRARMILDALAKDVGENDRIDVWTVNIANPSATRSLTNGFQAPKSEAITAAITKLTNSEYCAGAVDLPAGIDEAIKSFEQRAGRQQVLLFLGDGESAASKVPLTETTRVEMGNKLADKEIAFIAVPLGVKVHAENLHGLAMQTGGTVVRLTDDLVSEKTSSSFMTKLKTAFDTPILRTERATFGPEGIEIYPTRLPPLRGDRSTLIIGKAKTTVQTVSARIEGRVAGVKVTVDLSEKLASPITDNYFLSAMVDQWKAAPAKDAPAMLAADRTLAMASEQFRLFRDEFTVQGVWAISADRLDHAEKFFQAATNIDPLAVEAQSGLQVIAKIRGGNMKSDTVKIGLANGASLARLQEPQSSQPKTDAVPGGKPAQPAAGGTTQAERTLIDQAKNSQAVLEGEYRIVVDETLRRARRLMTIDPDAAYEDLKRQRDSVLNNDQLSEAYRRKLSQDLETSMREVTLKGSELKRSLAAQRERIAQSRQRLNEFEQNQTQEEQTRARIDSFRQLMNQARFELAQQEAQVMIQERVSRGQPIPPEAFASYRIGQSATNLRELTELKRLRENNYLLTMMQVEKSFIPYPDEPPVHFPPAAVWRELTGSRSQKYSNSELGPDAAPSFRRLRAVLEGEAGKKVQLKSITGNSLETLLGQLQQEFADEGVRFVFRTDLFAADTKPGETKIKAQNDLSGLPLGAFLDTILRDIQMTWIARPEYIEIGPNDSTYSLRYNDKVSRVFDVAELIVGIPNAQSTSALIQNLQFLGQQSTIFGAALIPFAAGGGAVGGFGGALGAGGGFGAVGGGFGGGGFGGGGGGFGGGGGLGQGGGGLGGQQGGMGQLGGGVIGGALGGQQGQQGQLGQLGSAFTIRGNDQSQVLVQLITQVVAAGEWNLRGIGGFTQGQLANQFDPNSLEASSAVDARTLNSIGYYPPARALIIRGSHRYHSSPSFNLKRGEVMAAGGPGLPRNGQFAGNDAVGNKPKSDETKAVAMALAKSGNKDPEKLWNLAFSNAITKQDVVIDAADILFEMNEFGHATEALKASLRKGRANGIWTHEALAIGLQSTQATPAEIERASLSGIDLDPTSSKLFLQAAKAESQLGNNEIALAFCQRAAALEPNSPTSYANALVYAEKFTDVKSDVVQWASTNLLSREWATDGTNYHAEAKSRVGKIATKFVTNGRTDDAAKLRSVTAEDTSRDLVIELLYQGRADLDLSVTEPSGSHCSASNKRTTGGGVLKSDIMEQLDDARSEIYMASQAFSGTYTINVRKVVGDPIDNRARVKVTKNQGTPKESVEVFSFDMANPKAVTIQLENGTRSELATVPNTTTETQLETTQAAGSAPVGISGGFGDRFNSTSNVTAALPPVKPADETRLRGISDGMPGLRFETKLTDDRKNVVMSAKPVFTGPAHDILMPKINLIPGK